MTDPSPERLRASRARGEIAVSQRLSIAASLAFALALTGTLTRLTRECFDRSLRTAISFASSGDTAAPPHAIREALSSVLTTSAPALAATLVGVALAHSLQTRFLVVWPDEEPAPSPFALRDALATALWTLSLLAVAMVSFASLARETSLAPHDLAGLARSLSSVLSGVAWRLTATAFALAVIELVARRARHFEALRLTRHEALREARDREGDPRTKAARARRMRA